MTTPEEPKVVENAAAPIPEPENQPPNNAPVQDSTEKEPPPTANDDIENVKDEKKKEIAVTEEENGASPSGIQKSSSFKEESNFLSDLKDNEKKALSDFKSKIEDAILLSKFFEEKKDKEKEKIVVSDAEQKEKSDVEVEKEVVAALEEGTKQEEGQTPNLEEKETPAKEDASEKEKEKEEETKEDIKQEAEVIVVDKDITLWGVPLLPSKGDSRTDVVLLKVLRARDFKVNDAFEMLKNIIKWRKQNKTDSIIEEQIDVDLNSFAYMEGKDRNGLPVCYNNFAVLGSEEMNGKTFEEKREKFMRGRVQLMEKGIQKLDFNAGGVCAFLQINDLKNTPLPTRKELRSAIKKAVELFQDNYPEYVAKNIFINVPFWYYAYSALFAPSLSQRTKSKFVYARTTKVMDTLLKYIAPSEIPVRYGGLRRENDSEFSVEDGAKEAFIKAGAQEIIEIPAPEVGSTLMWDLNVSGWEVNYREEFVPADEGSYTIIVQKLKRITLQEGTIRNSFTNKEPGKIVLAIENGGFKKKRVLYRYKTKTASSS